MVLFIILMICVLVLVLNYYSSKHVPMFPYIICGRNRLLCIVISGLVLIYLDNVLIEYNILDNLLLKVFI